MDERIGTNTDSIEDVFGSLNPVTGFWGPVDTASPPYGLMPVVTVSGSGSSADVTLEHFITVYIKDHCQSAACGGNGSNPACVVIVPVKSQILEAGVDFAGGSGSLDDATILTIKLID